MQARILKRWCLILALSCITLGSDWAGASEDRVAIETMLDRFSVDLKQDALEGNGSALRFQITASSLVFAAAIWSADGNLVYPDPDGITHVADDAILHDQRRLRSLLNEAAPTSWESRDVSSKSFYYCRKDVLSVCLLVNVDALADHLNLEGDEVVDVIVTNEDASWAWPILGAILLLTVSIGWPLLRTTGGDRPHGEAETFTLGDLVVMPRRLIGARGALTIDLTKRDVKLLAHLATHPGDVLSKNELYDVGWGRNFLPSSRALEQHMMTLRRKLDPDKTRTTVIETVHGQGYRFPSDPV